MHPLNSGSPMGIGMNSMSRTSNHSHNNSTSSSFDSGDAYLSIDTKSNGIHNLVKTIENLPP